MRKYAAYLVAQGHNVCILENDFGAVNVDAMLVQDLLGERCEIETISGGCDCDTHQRRMRTKLISMAMRGFDRVLVEPSGIFDVDEFFDVLRDEPLDRWYRLGNVIAIVDALLPGTLSAQADYILASEAANAGAVVFSRSQLADAAQRGAAQEHLNRALAACKCSRTFQPGELLTKPWDEWGSEDFAAIDRCGCRQASCESSTSTSIGPLVRPTFWSWASRASSSNRISRPSSPTPRAAMCCGRKASYRTRTAGWS